MSVPFIDLKRFETGFQEEWNAITAELSRNTMFIGGKPVADLEAALCKEGQVDHAISCANGTDALQLALRGVGVGPGDDVLLPDNTFWATFEAIVNVGAKPHTVDINLEDGQMDYETFVAAAQKLKPKAAMLVHLYGWASKDLKKFRDFCKKENIKLIEDGAQCFGVKVDGESIYKDALVSTISFYPAKVFGASGDAGAVVTSDESLAKDIRSLSNHGRQEHYAYGLCGWNSRMGSFEASYLNISFKHLEARLDSRRKFGAAYRERLLELGVKSIALPNVITENGYLNAALLPPAQRDALTAHLKAKGIGFGIIYPGPISEQKGAENLLAGKFGGEKAKELSLSILSLPLFPYMKNEEFEEVISTLTEAL